MRKIVFALAFLFTAVTLTAQTEEELKATLATKKDSISAIQGRADAIQAQIDALPGWKKGAFGTIGGSLSNFNNWFAQGAPNNSSGNITITGNAFANLKREKYFWNNSLNLNLGWVKLDNKDIATDSEDFEALTDVFQITSLYGWRLSDKFAISALGEYRTTLLNNFNDPGYLDLGVGGTWTPIDNMVVVIHPLNYNFVFAENDAVFASSLGAKIVADYTRQIGAVAFKSNLSAFMSYEGSELSNWTWTNNFSYTLWKGIGVGFDFGLRNSQQEAANFQGVALEDADNSLQSFYTVGLSYNF
ncbi:Hypothetical protein I595_3046 [Croceitalea dokdonensis DOKDO 023]|uniref:DUF3078 domain-containing protein n=1 Tax=Croceitalea dokdonensis DOKDO 023 TaxID=1300341 RepID=A0A0P7A3N3_9FLAO|nr:DUF3078 domain-containing protein [Croceitalea dokdonensis]KPM31067.1 Hypothetical protein I595_3046 [Croceitalea dokdonensis DOKDO 023]